MQAYIGVRQGRLMERWLQRKEPIDVYVWNADQDVCLQTASKAVDIFGRRFRRDQ